MGFTLLEVIVALAILAGSVAVLGEVIRLASRNATDAQSLAQAQLLAASLIDEMVAGLTEPADVTEQPLETDDAIPWVYSVTYDNTSIEGLMALEVVVEQDLEKQFNPVRYRLVRWLPDPLLSQGASDDASSGGDDG